ncbi:ABC1-domain-containing protein [Dentipellis sp. KUC8613]|nr:ABC1-domain-containing protein [Dentipellis sp. KUC8613]
MYRLRLRTIPSSARRFLSANASTSAGSSSSAPGPGPSRLRKYARRAGYTGLVLGAGYLVDKKYNASTVTRNIRTFYTCAIIAADYKLNFQPGMSNEHIVALHTRVAERLFNLLTSNGGLYIKFGQVIASNAALLPKPVQAKFSRLYDDAPQIPYSEVHDLFLSEFGRPPSGPDGMFEEFDEQAIASASIAQVHRARLWPEDRHEGDGHSDGWVAVKVQKPAVAKQMEPDLVVLGAVMWMYENWLFDMPVYFLVDFINDHLRQELDFINEAQNAKRTAAFVASDPSLHKRVHIPHVYDALTTHRIMTAEWIDGTRLSDRDGVVSLLGAEGTRTLVQTMTDLLSTQIFRWGWLHSDPHPGNVIVRPGPELVLLDHGLYVHLSETLRRQYAEFWTGMLALDLGTVRRIAGEWGIGMPEVFASAVALKPVRFQKGRSEEEQEFAKEMSQYEAGVRMKKMLKGFLTDTDKMPKELIFIGRTMRIMQNNNQLYGSPVNRIKSTGMHASEALEREEGQSAWQKVKRGLRHGVFLGVVHGSDLVWWLRRGKLGTSGGMEDDLEKNMQQFARDNLGVEINASTFEG